MRSLRIVFASLAAFVMLAAGMATADAAARYGKQKVVYHVNYPGGPDDKSYIGAMRNIQNHINAVGAKNLDLKVVIHGNGIGLLKSAKKMVKKVDAKTKKVSMSPSQLQTRVANLKSQNVSFNVCANTLKGKKIGLDQLYDVFNEDIVPSGVAELTHLQQQGYTYIKP